MIIFLLFNRLINGIENEHIFYKSRLNTSMLQVFSKLIKSTTQNSDLNVQPLQILTQIHNLVVILRVFSATLSSFTN